jgi:hypothetical protein
MKENNKLIAEFMGCTHPHNEITDATLYNVSHGTFELSELRYDVSWDWLMPVVQKCRQENRLEYFDFVYYALEQCDINITYKSVVEFIKDQNK